MITPEASHSRCLAKFVYFIIYTPEVHNPLPFFDAALESHHIAQLESLSKFSDFSYFLDFIA